MGVSDRVYLEAIARERWAAHDAQHVAAANAALLAKTDLGDALELARKAAEERIKEAAGVIDGRLVELNKLRVEVITDRGDLVRRDNNELALAAIYKTIDDLDAAADKRLSALENWRSRALGAAAVLTVLAGALGAAIFKVLGG
jgi:hypothetical protein